MRVLALDTTTRAGSVAIVDDDDRVIGERAGDAARTHAERLPGEILALLDACHLAIADVDLFAVASGPGSFTGLRIGIATMQGFAVTCRRRMVGVSALDALGHLGSEGAAPSAIVASWMDAHRGEVFAGLYQVRRAPLFDPERLMRLGPPMVSDPAQALALSEPDAADSVTFIGDGAVKYGDVIGRVMPDARILPLPLLAGAIGRLALARARRGDTIDAAGLLPLYIRRPDAEVARDRGMAH